MADVRFLADHGENVTVSPDGAKATWNFVYMGGIAFSKDPIDLDRIIDVTLSESGHVQFGLTYKNPTEIVDVRKTLQNDVIIVNDIRVHRKVCDIKVQLIRKLDKGFEVTFTDTKGEKIQCTSVDADKQVWLVVHLKFGSIRASVGRTHSNTTFHEVKGENILLTNDNKEISLQDANPGTACCLSRCLTPGTAVRLSISPIISGNKHPRKYHVTLGYARIEPKNFKTISAEHFSIKEGSSVSKPWHFLTRLKKHGDITIQFVDDNEVRIDEHLYPLRVHPGRDNAICLVLEVFRVSVTVRDFEEIDLSKFQDLNAYEEISHRVESRVDAVENSLLVESHLVNFPEIEDLEDLKQDIENAYTEPLPVTLYSRSDNSTSMSTDDSRKRKHSVEYIYEKISNISRSIDIIQKQSQSQSFRSDLAAEKVDEIRVLLERLLDPPSDIKLPKEDEIREKLRKNYQRIVNDLELLSLIDILFQDNVLSLTEYDDLRERHKTNRRDANRDFVGIFMRRPFDVTHFVKAFKDTKQGFLLSLDE